MKDGNALILSAGRRVGLVRAFQSKIECLALRSKVFCTDLKPSYSAACLVADGFFIVPRCDDEEFIPTLLRICNENHVRIVVPTIDPELAILSACRELFRVQGVDIIVSDFDFVQQCDDKRNLPQLANFLGLETPRIFDAHELEYPCFCKPFNGSSGKGAFPVLSASDLSESMIRNSRNIFMELVPDDYVEYTCDVYFDKHSRLKCLVPRERLEVRAGEVSKAVTRMDFVYDRLLPKLSRIKQARGPITLQCFVHKQRQDIQLLEINPRFGGGYPLTEESGVSYVTWLLQEYLGEKELDFRDDWLPNNFMLRYDSQVIVRNA